MFLILCRSQQTRSLSSLLPSTPYGSWTLVGGGWAATGHGFHVHQLSLLMEAERPLHGNHLGCLRKVCIPGPPGHTESEALGGGARHQHISRGFHHPWQLETQCLSLLRVGTAMSILQSKTTRPREFFCQCPQVGT